MATHNPTRKPNQGTEKIHDLHRFIRGYLASENGKRALARGPIKDTWRNSAMTQAFANAVGHTNG